MTTKPRSSVRARMLALAQAEQDRLIRQDRKDGEMTSNEIRKELGVSKDTARHILDNLVAQGVYIKRRGTRFNYYHLADEYEQKGTLRAKG